MLKFHNLNDLICSHRNNAPHGVEVPPNARILFCNGQVGARLDGTVPEDPREQLKVIFERIGIILAASKMTFDDVVKFTVYFSDSSIPDWYSQEAMRIIGAPKPSTVIAVNKFPRPGVVLEIEAIAAKAD